MDNPPLPEIPHPQSEPAPTPDSPPAEPWAQHPIVQSPHQEAPVAPPPESDEIIISPKYKLLTGSKAFDFILGAVGIAILMSIISQIFGMFTAATYAGRTNYSFSNWIPLITLISICYYLYKQKYRYVLMGYITTVIVLPLLVFGSCFLIIGGLAGLSTLGK